MAVGQMYENVIRNNTDKGVIMTDKSTSVRNVPWVKGVGAGRKKRVKEYFLIKKTP